MSHRLWLSSNNTPEKLLAIANIDLENARKNLESARKEINSKKALNLAKDAKSDIHKAEKILSDKRCKNPSLEQGIANAYHEHGELLVKLGDSKHAQDSFSKAQKWGYTRKVSEHNLQSQSSDKSGSSNQSVSHLESLSPIQSLDTPDRHVTDSRDTHSFSGDPAQEITSPKAEKTILTSTPDVAVGCIPTNIFKQDVNPPTVKCELPEIGGRISSAQQLVYCLELFATASEELKSEEQDWALKVKENADEKERLESITNDLIRAFAGDNIKDSDEVNEIVWLAPVLSQDCFRNLLQILVDGINNSALLKVSMVDGLVRLMRNSGPRAFDTDDLVKILDLLSSRLEKTHDQSNQLIYKLTLAVSAVLDSMADNKVVGLNREQLHEPLFNYLRCLMERPESYLMYQAAYTFQALQYVPNDESQFQAIQRTGVTLLQGVIGVAAGAKGMDIGGVIDGLKKIRDAGSEIVRPFVFNIKANIESGQSLMSNLKDGFQFKRDWYPALRAIDISLRNGRLSEVKQLVNQAPGYLDPAFQLGLCQRLGELAINPLWDMDSRQDSIDLLEEIYRNDAKWGQHDEVKKYILPILRQLKDSSDRPVSEKAQTLLQSLQYNGDLKKQIIYGEYEKDLSSFYPLMIAQLPNKSRLFDQIHSKPGLSTILNTLRKERLNERREELYISPMAKRSLNAKETEIFEMKSDLQSFLKSDKKVFLILGDSGSGKSTFNRALEMDLWQDYNKMDKRIPLFINLPSIENPDKDLITKQLRNLNFENEHIQELRQNYEFILICDGYDETQSTKNLYDRNNLNKKEGWRAQMVISCRTEYNGVDYIDRFQPIDRNTVGTSVLFQEAVIMPFKKDQIQGYIEKYVSLRISTESLWKTEDYIQVLEQIPTLKDLVENPFLLKLAMEVLPRLVDLKEDNFRSKKITRIVLYDEFVKQWLERNRKRLSEITKEKTDMEEYDKLCDSGFTERGITYIRDMATAIYIQHDGKPVFNYPNNRTQNSWQDIFFDKKNGNHLLQQAIPLIRNGKQYRFIHKSVLEYGLTLSVFATNQVKEPVSTQSFRECTGYVRGLEMEIPEDDLDELSEQDFIDTPFGKKSFVNEPSILQFLVERVQQQPSVFKKLISAIELSKTNNDARIAAANAITVLVRAGIQFNGADLRNIKVPGADLSYGVFNSTHLEGADLREANLRNIWLRQANLEGAQMDGVQFGELPFLQEDDLVYRCVCRPDGNMFAAGLRNGTISLYETSNWNRRILTGHDHAVSSISFSTTSNRIASGSWDRTVRLWDVDTGKCVHILQGHSDNVNSVAYSPKGDRIASGSRDETVRVWDVDTGECVHILQGHSGVILSVVYSPKGDRIASGSHDKTVRLWDDDTGKCIHILQGHSNDVNSIMYSPKGDRITSGSSDLAVRLWDVDTGKCIHILQGHSGCVTSVVYSPKGDQIASGSDDKTVRLWDVDTGKCVHILQGHSFIITGVVYSPKGDRIASGSSDETVRLWDVVSGECIHILRGHGSLVMSVVYLPKGNRIASGSSDKTVRVWDVDTSECVPILHGHSNVVESVVYSPKGDHIASGSRDKTVRLWDVDTGECIHILQGHSNQVTSVVYSPKGDRIASGSSDKTVRVWDVDTGECVHILQGHSDCVSNIVYSPKGDRIASGSDDLTVRLWDVGTGECLHSLQGHSSRVTSVVYSPKGDRIASGSGDLTVRLWDVDTGECVHVLKGHSRSVRSVVYSPKGDRIASGNSDNTVRLWDVDTGKCVHILRGHSRHVWSVVYSPKGDRIVSGSHDRTVRLWNVDTGECVHILQGHSSWVTSVVYSPKGDRIASGSNDRTVRVWNTQTGRCETIISDFNGDVYHLAFRNDPSFLTLATGSGDKSVRLWNIVKENDEYMLSLCWSSSHEVLTLTDALFHGVRGLSPLNRKLVIQRKAFITAPPPTEMFNLENA